MLVVRLHHLADALHCSNGRGASGTSNGSEAPAAQLRQCLRDKSPASIDVADGGGGGKLEVQYVAYGRRCRTHVVHFVKPCFINNAFRFARMLHNAQLLKLLFSSAPTTYFKESDKNIA